MSFSKDAIKRPVVVFPATGGACTVPTVLDFTRSRPGPAKDLPRPYRTKAGAALRFRPRASGRGYVPVDPALLATHLEFGEGGRVIAVSEALVNFLGRVSLVSTKRARRLQVGGDPAVNTRSICRGTQLNIEPRTYFCGTRCQFRGCTNKVVAGTLCALHYDSTFVGGLSRHKAGKVVQELYSRKAEEELGVLFGPFDHFWVSLAEWLCAAPVRPELGRAYVVNHALGMLPQLALTELSADRLSALAHCAHPSVQGAQAFYNAQLSILYIRTIRGSLPVLAANLAGGLSSVYLYGLPCSASGSTLLCDRGLVPHIKMPVVPALEEVVGNVSGLICSTVIPDAGEELVNVVFNTTALCVLSRVFGNLGNFSFTVLTGTLELPPGALVLDAALPLDVTPFMGFTGNERAEKVLYVLTPAALSPVVLHAIIFRLRFKHVYFCGPRFGSRGIRLPIFKSGRGDPTVGWLWRCILDEAESRGQLRSSGTGDPLWRHKESGFLDTFVTPGIPGRCDGGCSHCSSTSLWHLDHLVGEAAYGEQARELLAPCALLGTELFDEEEAQVALRRWRTLCDLTTEAIFSE